MITFKTILISLLAVVTCPASEPLSLSKLREIVKSDHNEVPLVEALRIYPEAREYNITVTNRTPDGQQFKGKAIASEKWVDGRFIVSELQLDGPETKFTMVVDYDDEQKLYRKYVIMDDKLSGYQVGTRIGKTRSVSWIDLSEVKFKFNSDNLTIETHTDTRTTWKTIFFQDGKLQRVESGVALVTRKAS